MVCHYIWSWSQLTSQRKEKKGKPLITYYYNFMIWSDFQHSCGKVFIIQSGALESRLSQPYPDFWGIDHFLSGAIVFVSLFPLHVHSQGIWWRSLSLLSALFTLDYTTVPQCQGKRVYTLHHVILTLYLGK